MSQKEKHTGMTGKTIVLTLLTASFGKKGEAWCGDKTRLILNGNN